MANTYEILNEHSEVINTIIADQSFVDQHYSGQYRLVEEIVEENPVPEPVVLTVLQLRRLFTLSEKIALEDAIRAGNSGVKVLMDDLSSAEFVDLEDPLVITGLQLLVQLEFLTQERAEQILNNQPPVTEEIPEEETETPEETEDLENT